MTATEVSLIVGADGLVGRALADQLDRTGQPALETTRRFGTTSDRRLFLDMAMDVSGWRPPAAVRVAYLCAAVTSLKRCHEDPLNTARLNVQNTVAVANTLVSEGVFVVYISSNLVYDGSTAYRTAEDPVCPVTEYGRQKAETERQLLSLGERVSIVRFTKIICPTMPLFTGWKQALQCGQQIRPFRDMVMAPIPLEFAVQVLRSIADKHINGIIQASGAIDITYEEAAHYIAKRIGASRLLVHAMNSQQGGYVSEAIPAHTTLDISRLRGELGMAPPHVWSSIDSVLD